MRVLPAAERAASPWKNGGGVTREVAAWPPGSGFEDFAWRVSMAEVRADGPFSSFPDIDRVLCVVEGALRLDIAAAGGFDLTPESPPLAFDGAAATTGSVGSGPVLDLNVMSRRGRARARVEIAESAARRLIDGDPGHRLILPADGGVRVYAAEGAFELSRHDALLADTEDGALVLEPESPGRIYVVFFEEA
jgi:environmental stress-induced protein Ves